mmetsp:Transcript_10550/g.17253  ORF Transcript_10550/g.17253 Transcript_10550/m.17253 type:complete len:226 (-) Transcript_10550:934-1611(-)
MDCISACRLKKSMPNLTVYEPKLCCTRRRTRRLYSFGLVEYNCAASGFSIAVTDVCGGFRRRSFTATKISVMESPPLAMLLARLLELLCPELLLSNSRNVGPVYNGMPSDVMLGWNILHEEENCRRGGSSGYRSLKTICKLYMPPSQGVYSSPKIVASQTNTLLSDIGPHDTPSMGSRLSLSISIFSLVAAYVSFFVNSTPFSSHFLVSCVSFALILLRRNTIEV